MSKSAKIAVLIIGSYFLQLLFDLIPYPANPQKLFLLVDGRDFGMTLEWYVYFCGEHLARMAIFYAGFLLTDIELADRLFMIEVMDLTDYMMIANTEWIEGTHFEFNFIKIGLVIYFTWREFANRRLVHY